MKTDNPTGWHKACIRRFFTTTSNPKLEINEATLEAIALESTSKGMTVPGVQKKISLHLDLDNHTPCLTLLNYPAGYILKPQVDDFGCLSEATGISTVPHVLIGSRDNPAYITKRIDRIIGKSETKMLAMEDFCQLDLRVTADKYKGSYERCAKVIRKYFSNVGLDLAELFMRIVFSFMIGNSDMHLKNFSLIETEEASNTYVLSHAYDLLPVNVIMPEDTEEFALVLNGKKTHIRKKDFLIFAEQCGISKKSAEKMIYKIVSMKSDYLKMCNSSLLPDYMKNRFTELIERRCMILE